MTAGDSDSSRYGRHLAELQHAFRAIYDRRKQECIEALRRGDPPIVMRLSDEELLLVGPDGTERFDLDTNAYDTLKQLSHIAPLAALLLDGPDNCSAGREEIDRALLGLHEERLDGEAAVIVASTRQLLGDFELGTAEFETLVARYRQTVRPALEQAARKAAQADLDALAQAMRKVEARIGKPGLGRVFLVICGGHQSRRHELTGQFYRRWLAASLDENRADGHRILYAEHRDSVDEVLDLVATRIVDEHIAARLFDDPTRLDEDILGDAARHLLESTASVRDFGR